MANAIASLLFDIGEPGSKCTGHRFSSHTRRRVQVRPACCRIFGNPECSSPDTRHRAIEMRAFAGLCVACIAAVDAQDTSILSQLSFAAPFDEINQFSGLRNIGGWEIGGSAEVHRSFVRLTAEKQGQKGWMLSQTPLALPEWGAMLEVRASGMSPHLYGDGAQPLSYGIPCCIMLDDIHLIDRLSVQASPFG